VNRYARHDGCEKLYQMPPATEMLEVAIQPSDVTDEEYLEVALLPSDDTDEQKASRLRFEKWQVKWIAASVERARLHELKPVQERFFYAVTLGEFEKVAAFLETGEIDVNKRSGHYSPLQMAAKCGYAEIVQTILVHGADVSYVNPHGHSALILTILYASNRRFQQFQDVVKTLLRHGADINTVSRNTGQTALQCAVVRAPSSIVKILLDHGADISRVDHEGHNAMHLLSFREPRGVAVQNKICRMLLDHGSDTLFKLDVLQTLDYGMFDTDDSDSEGDIPSATPFELAQLMGKAKVASMLHAAETVLIQQHHEVSKAKNARDEAYRRLKHTAFAMGQHPRLGAESNVIGLSPDMLKMVLSYV
jgi:ankyrin repeat protein